LIEKFLHGHVYGLKGRIGLFPLPFPLSFFVPDLVLLRESTSIPCSSLMFLFALCLMIQPPALPRIIRRRELFKVLAGLRSCCITAGGLFYILNALLLL